MSLEPPPNQPIGSATNVPGRLHAFVTIFLASFVLGLTYLGLQAQSAANTPPHHSSADADQTLTALVGTATRSAPRLTRPQLKSLAGIACGIAVLSLLPRRGASETSDELTPQWVAQSTGLPILGNLFATSKRGTESGGRRSASWLRRVVVLAELSLILAFTLSLAACVFDTGRFSDFRQDPFAGYVGVVSDLVATAHTWIAGNSTST